MYVFLLSQIFLSSTVKYNWNPVINTAGVLNKHGDDENEVEETNQFSFTLIEY